MAICVQLTSGGTLVPTGDDPSVCPAYVLVSGSEYSLIGVIDTALGVPDTATATEWVTGPFIFIMTIYLASRMAGALGNFFGK